MKTIEHETPPGAGRAVLLGCALALTLAGCPRPIDADAGPGTDAGVPVDAEVFRRPLRIGTWNIEQFPKTSTTVERTAALIQDMNVDLLGVQEISDLPSFVRLGELLPNHDVVFANNPGAFTVDGLVYRSDRLEVSEVATIFADDSYAFPRPMLGVTVRDRGTGFDFRLHVLHLKANVDEESRMRREAAINRIDLLVRGQLGDPAREHDLVFVGDWNDELTDPGAENVFTPLLDAPDVYRFLTLPLEQSGDLTYLPFSAFIDHIMITTDVNDEYGAGFTAVQHFDVTVSDYRDVLSDHLPVVAQFELP